MSLKFVPLAAAALVLAAMVLGAPAYAHHSTAMFDMEHTTNLVGTVKDFQWTQPHTWIDFDVPGANGAAESYGVEGMSPSYLGRNGWSKHTLNPGDKVTLSIHPLKDGRKGGFDARVTWPNGKVMYNLPQRGGAAAAAAAK